MTPESTDEMAALKSQVFILLIALIVVSGTLTVYLYRQESLANKDLAELQVRAAQTNTNAEAIKSLVDHLLAFGEKHPDFQAVLRKDGFLAPNAAAPTPAAPAAPHK
jgi:hypothetical protein